LTSLKENNIIYFSGIINVQGIIDVIVNFIKELIITGQHIFGIIIIILAAFAIYKLCIFIWRIIGGQHSFAMSALEKLFFILGIVALALYAAGYFAENIQNTDPVSQFFKIIAVGVKNTVNGALAYAWQQIQQITGGKG